MKIKRESAIRSFENELLDSPPMMSRPRVYWLTEAFYPPLVGGQELIAAALAAALVARGLAVHVVTRQTVPPCARAERIGQVEVRRIEPAGLLKGRGWRALFPLAGFLFRIAWMLISERQRYDVVMVSGVKVMPLIVVPLARVLGKRCILRAESYFELHEPISTESLQTMGMAGRWMLRRAEQLRNFSLRRASVIIAISSQIRGELLRRGIAPERVVDLPNAVSLAAFSPLSREARTALRARLDLTGRTVLVYSGRLARAKGVPLLVSIWPTLARAHADLFLLIVGSGSRSFDDCEAEVKRTIQVQGMSGRVRFIEETRDIAPYLQASDVWVFPSDYEGFSLALAEAMACGCVVVATEVGAAPDLIVEGKSGFLCEPKNPAALNAALERALAARDAWPRIGASARERVEPFNLERIADRYASLCAS